MQEKDIKRLVTKQLKNNFPHWRRLTKKEKKRLAEEALQEVMASYNKKQVTNVPINELTNTPSVPLGIISLSEMDKYIENNTRNLLPFTNQYYYRHLNDPELRLIDTLLDNRILNCLLANSSYTPSMRHVSPAQLFRAELLKALRYGEMSYRKYCQLEINKLENKTNRTFLHLPLHKNIVIHHSQLSQFRSSLSISQMINLMVYVTHLLIKEIKIPHPFQICGVDSTDLASSCCPVPLTTITVGDKKVKIYSELDVDCGKRRKKRNKSEYFVGYRLHSLVIIDPQTGHNYPLFSMVAPANHHDNLFLPQLLTFAQAMGLSIQVITADEAYGDAEQNAQIKQDHGVTVVTPPNQKVKTPEHVDPQRRQIFADDFCEIPMQYIGSTDSGHEFQCDASSDECWRAPLCSQCREIPFDSGYFGQIPNIFDELDQILQLRKHMERSYNLFKHRAGLEHMRLRSQQGAMAAVTFAHLATVFVEIATHQQNERKNPRPKQLALAA